MMLQHWLCDNGENSTKANSSEEAPIIAYLTKLVQDWLRASGNNSALTSSRENIFQTKTTSSSLPRKLMPMRHP
jgi:hypothetical protein